MGGAVGAKRGIFHGEIVCNRLCATIVEELSLSLRPDPLDHVAGAHSVDPSLILISS